MYSFRVLNVWSEEAKGAKATKGAKGAKEGERGKRIRVETSEGQALRGTTRLVGAGGGDKGAQCIHEAGGQRWGLRGSHGYPGLL